MPAKKTAARSGAPRRKSAATNKNGPRRASGRSSSPEMTSVEELFKHELKDMYSAEHLLVEALSTIELAEKLGHEVVIAPLRANLAEEEAALKRLQALGSRLEAPTMAEATAYDEEERA
jgi:hypothetical protein